MKYRKIPVVIDAVEWNGKNQREIEVFAGACAMFTHSPNPDHAGKPPSLTIYTLEGQHDAKFGDFIIRGVKGEFYPCKPDVFALTYEHAPRFYTAPEVSA